MRNALFLPIFVSAIHGVSGPCQAPIVQPGAPGEAVKNLTAHKASRLLIPAIRPTTLLLCRA